MLVPSTLLAGRRVLLADDEAFSLSIVSRMLRELGCADVIAVDGGVKALEVLCDKTRIIDLAVIDFNMPEVNGLQILKVIRTGRVACPRGTPVVMLTGTADGGLVSAAAALDVGTFVVKPVSKANLGNRLVKTLAEQRELRPVEIYEPVEIDTVSKALIGSYKPIGGAKTTRDRIDSPYGVKLRLDAIPVGSVLEEDIRGPDGELLLGRGAVLSERFLRRLRDLSGVAGVEHLIIRQPKKND